MRLGTASQQPTERLSYTIQYEDILTDGDDLSSATAVVTPAGLTVDSVGIYDTRVKFWVTGGVDGTAYKVTVTTDTADGRTFQDEVTIKIKEL
jgi:hypothetical protein